MSAVRTLLDELIDYAGLFPPAGLAMRASVENYAAYAKGPWNWALGRCIFPAARLEEFERECEGLGSNWKLSVLGIPQRMELHCGRVDTLELKAQTAQEVFDLAARATGANVYIEIPVAEDPAHLIDAIATAGVRAKIRTGGVTPDMFPAPRQVARFLRRCAEAKVPFKATAGLHHPLRAEYNLTYEPHSARNVMHGFLNVFLAAMVLYFSGREQDAVATLEETSVQAFHVGEDEIRWHEHRLTSAQIQEARSNFAISFGSCSFDEPIQDLQTLGWL
ncbi:MAG: hypothetical protein ABL995_07320 [Bryobacteraceae bacterium]